MCMRITNRQDFGGKVHFMKQNPTSKELKWIQDVLYKALSSNRLISYRPVTDVVTWIGYHIQSYDEPRIEGQLWFVHYGNDLSLTKYSLWPLLLTWFNFNPSMDK